MSADRADYIAGLRKLADALEANEAMRVPWQGGEHSPWTQYCDSRDEMSAWVALLDDAVDHGIRMVGATDWYEVSGHIEGIRVQLNARPQRLGGTSVTREVEQFEVEPFLPVQS
jgi:hypothetical protein